MRVRGGGSGIQSCKSRNKPSVSAAREQKNISLLQHVLQTIMFTAVWFLAFNVHSIRLACPFPTPFFPGRRNFHTYFALQFCLL
jgi:hypothetical protein